MDLVLAGVIVICVLILVFGGGWVMSILRGGKHKTDRA